VSDIESEGNDRVSIDFPGVQSQFIQKISSCSKGPVILILMSGGSVDISAQKQSSAIKSIMWVGYPGQSGGDAIAQILFGDYNPGGRLPFTIFQANLINQVSMEDMGMRPNATTGNPGRTYRFFTGSAVYPFGYGLSYTTFQYTWTAIAEEKTLVASQIEQDIKKHPSPYEGSPMATMTVNVTNTGNLAGSDVVLAFRVPPNPGKNGNPIRILFGFERIFLLPGQSQIIRFVTFSHDFTLADQGGNPKVHKGTWKIQIGNDLEQEISLI